MLPSIQVLPGYQKRFLAGYPWLYANEIAQSHATKTLEPGQGVVLEYQGKALAKGYFNRHSLISFRVLSRDPKETIDADFFSARLAQALKYRQNFYDTPYYRLVHAEADALPGLIIDRFDTVFVIQINTQGMENLKAPLLEALQKLFQPTTIYLKNDSAVRTLEGLDICEAETIGEPLEQLKVIENNCEFRIDMRSSQKTGWFFDHRENRQRIAKLAQHKTVLDYFCYSGGFSIQAAKNHAKRVIGVDRSETALLNARCSAQLNGVENICEFSCRDIFEDLEARIQNQEIFDIVILDPPAFVKSKKDLVVGLKGYEKLLSKAIALVAEHGFLMIASCSYHVKEADLKMCLARALHKHQREGRIVQILGAGPDHPQHPLLEESGYLKGFLIECMGTKLKGEYQ